MYAVSVILQFGLNDVTTPVGILQNPDVNSFVMVAVVDLPPVSSTVSAMLTPTSWFVSIS